jgi:hypothetical protein
MKKKVILILVLWMPIKKCQANVLWDIKQRIKGIF